MIRKGITLLFLLLVMYTPIRAEESPQEPLKVAYTEYMPFFFKGADSKPRGILVDFWNLWSKKTGVSVTFHTLPWAETLTQVQDSKIDINAGVFYTVERDVYLDFSQPFYDVSTHLFYRATVGPFTGIDELAGKRVGLVTADFSVAYMRKNQPAAIFVEYPSYEQLVVAAIKGEVEAFVMGDAVAMTYLAKHNGLKIISRVDTPVYTSQFRAGVREGKRELLELVNQGLAAISQDEVDAIVRSWTGEPKPRVSRPSFKKVIIANCVDSVPFHFNDENGRPVGMLIDLWHLWSKKTGIAIEFKSSAWPGTLNMVRDGQADIHAGCFYSEERDKYLDYAAALRGCNTHFFFHDSIFGLKTLDDLISFKIGVIERDYAVDYLKQELPEAVLAEYPSNDDLFDAVERGEIRVFVYDTPASLYYLAQKGLTHRFRYHFDRPLYSSKFYAAVQEGNSMLIEEINRGMQMITAEERAEIERKWMWASDTKTKDVLVIACAMGYPPFTMLNSEGKPAGLFIDLWRLWAKKTGEKIEFRFTEWANTLEALRDGSADFHSGLYSTEGRSTWVNFSQPIHETRSNLFYRVDHGEISGLDELEGQKVGALRGAYASIYLRENWPDIEVADFETSKAIIIAAGEGRIRAFLDETPTTMTLLNRLGRASEFKFLPEPLYSKKIFAGVRKDNPALLAKIDAGLSAITNEELIELESRWIPDPNDRYFKPHTDEITFTAEEEAWLREHEAIRLGVTPDWPPFEYIGEDGTYMGMVSGYIRIINERIGMRMERAPNLSWAEVLVKGKARELDVFSCAVETPERKTFMRFTRPYLSFPCVIMTRKQVPFIGGLRDLHGKKVAIERDYCTHEALQVDHPAIDLHVVGSTLEALKALSLGTADAYVGNLATASYHIQNEGLTNLKVAAPTSYGNYDLRLAVRSDWPELVGILNKCLASITQQQHDEIRKKWFSVRFEHGISRAYLLKLGLQIGGVVAAILFLVFLWNRQIRRREEHFRGLTEHGMDITQAFTESGKIVYQSPSHTNILGYAPKELLGKCAFDLFHEEDKAQWESVLTSLLNGDGVEFFEHRLRHKQGYYQYFESNCINLLNNKALKAIVLNARDVTERKRAEEGRRENEEKLQNISASAQDAIIMMDNDGNISYWNEAAVKIFGYTKEEAIGQELHMFISPERYHEAYKQGYSRFQWTGEGDAVGKTLELLGVKKDGTEFPFELSLSAVKIKTKWNAIGILRDITERKQAEEALRESERGLAEAQRIAHLGNWDWNILTDELVWSDEIYRIFGLQPQEFGATYDAFLNSVHPDDREAVKEAVNKSVSDPNVAYNIEHRVVRPDGSERIVYEQGEVIFVDTQKPVRMVGTVLDITERKRAEGELRNTHARLVQSEKMASLGMLVAGVAHEINNPVGAISSMHDTLMRAIERLKSTTDFVSHEFVPREGIHPFGTETVKGDGQPDDRQKAGKLLKVIDDANRVITAATERVSDIVGRLKSFARLDEAELKIVDIHEGLEDTLTMIHHELEHKVVVERNFGNVPPIPCYPSQLNQVCLNLLLNAVEAIEDKGKITITTFQEDSRVHIQIEDTGVGIPEAARPKIFDPGYTTKSGGVGTGLGLSICYQIVKEHHGEIMVESEVGKGTTFTVILPITPAKRDKPADTD